MNFYDSYICDGNRIIEMLLLTNTITFHIESLKKIKTQPHFETFLRVHLKKLPLKGQLKMESLINSIATSKHWKEYKCYILWELSKYHNLGKVSSFTEY